MGALRKGFFHRLFYVWGGKRVIGIASSRFVAFSDANRGIMETDRRGRPATLTQEEREMLLSEWLKQENKTWHYTGTIWGDEEYDATGEEFAEMLDELDYDGEFGDHPLVDPPPTWDPSFEGRYYLHGNEVWFIAHLVEEQVLIPA